MKDAPKVLQSELLRKEGFIHAFSLREGGVSQGAYESLNLGYGVGDSEENVDKNIELFCKSLAYPREQWWMLSQVHSNKVVTLGRSSDRQRILKTEADALVADASGLAIAVRTADCVPVLVADKASGKVAAIHAGWRGAVHGVVSNAVQTLRSLSKKQAHLIAAIGPHIRVENFEVGEEVAELIKKSASERPLISKKGDRFYANLEELVLHQLLEQGLRKEDIDLLSYCTFENETMFFSHRRDRGVTGRHLSSIISRDDS